MEAGIECPECGSEDVDICRNIRHVFECCECGREFDIEDCVED